jgi:hypothetical protein
VYVRLVVLDGNANLALDTGGKKQKLTLELLLRRSSVTKIPRWGFSSMVFGGVSFSFRASSGDRTGDFVVCSIVVVFPYSVVSVIEGENTAF